MAGVATDLVLAQLGQETVYGTAVAATYKPGGLITGAWTIDDTVIIPDENGRMSPGQNAAEVMNAAAAALDYVAEYENLAYFLHSLFGTNAAHYALSGAGPYTRTYTAPTTIITTPQKFTMEFGAASGAAYKMAGALVNKLTLKGEAGNIWSAISDWIGKSLATVTQASLGDPATQNLIRMADTVLYVDAWGGTMGATAVAASIIGFELTVENGRHLKFFGGSIAAGDFGEKKWKGQLKTRLEYNSSVKAYIDALIAPALTQRQIRIKATDSTRVAQIDFCGTITGKPKLFTDRDGNLGVELTWDGTYSTVFGNWLKVTVTNAQNDPLT